MLSDHAGTSSLRKLNDLDAPQPIGHYSCLRANGSPNEPARYSSD
jgi:hypothetical protein